MLKTFIKGGMILPLGTQIWDNLSPQVKTVRPERTNAILA